MKDTWTERPKLIFPTFTASGGKTKPPYRQQNIGQYSVLTLWLSLGMIAVNIHGEIESVVDHLYIISRKLVGFVDAFGVPVCPV